MHSARGRPRRYISHAKRRWMTTATRYNCVCSCDDGAPMETITKAEACRCHGTARDTRCRHQYIATTTTLLQQYLPLLITDDRMPQNFGRSGPMLFLCNTSRTMLHLSETSVLFIVKHSSICRIYAPPGNMGAHTVGGAEVTNARACVEVRTWMNFHFSIITCMRTR